MTMNDLRYLQTSCLYPDELLARPYLRAQIALRKRVKRVSMQRSTADSAGCSAVFLGHFDAARRRMNVVFCFQKFTVRQR